MNTARATFQVGFFGDHWQIRSGDDLILVRSTRELVAVLSCKSRESSPAPEPKAPPTYETVEQYLARGGKIIRKEVPAAPPPVPPPTPEPVQVAPSRLTLEMLFKRKS